MDIDIEKLKAEIKADVLKELTRKDYHNPQKYGSSFNEIRGKYKDELHKTFGNITYWKVWERIRDLSKYIVDVEYQRDFSPSKCEKAAEIAEFLCKYAIEQRLNQ